MSVPYGEQLAIQTLEKLLGQVGLRPTDPMQALASSIPLLIGAGAVLAGVKIVADAYRTRKIVTESWDNKEAPSRNWFDRIPKKAISLALGVGLTGGALLLSTMLPKEKVHIEVEPRVFEFEPYRPVTEEPQPEIQPPPALPPAQEIPEPPPEYRGIHR